MLKILPKLLLLLFSLFFLLQCNPTQLGDPDVVVDIEDEFIIDIWEELHPLSRDFQLIAETLSPNPCLNTTIDISTIKKSNQLIITLNEIVEPEDCQEGEAPAHSKIGFGHLSPNFYELEINLKDIVINTGYLSVANDSYTVSMYSTDGFELKHNKLFKVPQNIIWGFTGHNGGNPEVESHVNAFMNELKDITNEKEDIHPGYYGHFSISEEKEITFETETEFEVKQLFYYQFENELYELKGLINSYREQYPGEFEIKLYLSNGEVL
ncbi:MAG: hypothetical protein GY705_23175 [Bacteroidetes bacterium]|nr:hypothetical protein [Bacteroidota bacterium]